MFLEYYYPIGGIERFVLSLSKVLPVSIDMTLVIKKYGTDVVEGVPKNVKQIEASRPLRGIGELFKVEKPDVLFINEAWLFSFKNVLRAKLNRIPVIYFCHSVLIYGDDGGTSAFISWLSWWYLRLFVSYCDVFIVPSDAVRDEFMKRGFRKLPIVMHPGVDSEQFKPVNGPEKSKLRQKYGFEDTSRVVCWAGRFSREKRLAMIIEAAKRMPEVNFLIVGFRTVSKYTKADHELIGEYEELPNVKILKNVGPSEIQEIYQLSDVVTSTSYYETYGSTISEAASCGITTVVPNHSGVREAGRGGYLYDYNLDSLVVTLAQALAEPKQSGDVTTNVENALKLQEIISILVR